MGRSKKLMLIALVVGAIMLMTESTAWAAQGQITEVNPSGIGHMSQRAVDVLSGLFAGFSEYVEFIRNSLSLARLSQLRGIEAVKSFKFSRGYP